MVVTLNIPTEVDVKFLKCSIGARYFEDASITDENGDWVEDDNEQPKIPCYNSKEHRWDITIDLDRGQILNWNTGTKAQIHYKSCDDNKIEVLDKSGNTVYYYQGYVPDILCPDDNGWGDYVIMRVDENGVIANFDNELIKELLNRQNFAK